MCPPSDSATPTVNPRTGLPDGYNPFFRVPVINHKSIGRLRLAGQTYAEHHVLLPGKRQLCFISRLPKSETLVVAFHGANVPRRGVTYPRYERVRTFLRSDAAFMCFADPTLQNTPEVLLAWYLGDPSFDPLDPIVQAVRKGMERTGAKHVIFVGGSGGGYAALRACLRIDGACAFVESPRIDLAHAVPRSMEAFRTTFWQGSSLATLRKEHPDRFDLAGAWPAKHTNQRVYYLQGLWDPTFLWNDFRRFQQAVGVDDPTGTSADGTVRFALFAAPTQGHQPPNWPMFTRHWQHAMDHFDTSVTFRPLPRKPLPADAVT